MSQVEPVKSKQLVEVLLVGDRRLRVDQLKVPVLVSKSGLNSFHVLRSFEVERVKVAENFQVGQRLDDRLGNFAADFRGPEYD